MLTSLKTIYKIGPGPSSSHTMGPYKAALDFKGLIPNDKDINIEVILYGSRAKGTAMERSDIDIAVSGVDNFESLVEKVEELPTLFSVDLVNMDTCRNRLLLEDIRQYGREI